MGQYIEHLKPMFSTTHNDAEEEDHPLEYKRYLNECNQDGFTIIVLQQKKSP
jgi:hypothetical protein